MDDLKLYANSRKNLDKLLEVTCEFSESICMKMGTDKCKIIQIEKGQLINSEGFNIDESQTIELLTENDNYKYLGYLQLKGIKHTIIKDNLKQLFNNKVHSILKTKLNSTNVIKAINTFAIPLLTYSFGIIKWSNTDLDELTRSIRVSMTKHRMHHPKGAVERMELPPEEGGLGIIHIKELHENQINSLKIYFHNKSEEHQMFKIICKMDKNITPLNLLTGPTEQVGADVKTTLIRSWKQKELHGTHINQLSAKDIDKVKSNLWLKQGSLFPETVGFMMAIQDRVIGTRNYRKYITKEKIENDRCRKCRTHTESIEHIIGGCPTIANTDYLHRHNNVGKIIHQELARKYGLIGKLVPYYKHEPPNVMENKNVKLYWDREIRTDIKMTANRPDIVIYDKTKKEACLIDISVPLANNINKTYTTKINKYTDLANEIQKMWRVKKVYIRPVILSATGIIPHTMVHQFKALEIENILSAVQKSVILDTCHITRRFLNHTCTDE